MALRIDKLKEQEDYTRWRQAILLQAKADNLEEFLLGTTTIPRATTVSSGSTKIFNDDDDDDENSPLSKSSPLSRWLMMDSKAMTLIYSSCEESVQLRLECTMDAHDMWTRLETYYGNTGYAGRYDDLVTLSGLRQLNCEGIEEYCQKFRYHAERLMRLDKKILTDEGINILFISGLSPMYEKYSRQKRHEFRSADSTTIPTSLDTLITEVMQNSWPMKE